MLNVYRTPALLQYLFPQLLWRVPTKEKVIYLTFDDGPVPGPTEYVLEVLNEFRAKATFFCIGDNIRKHPQIFEKVKQAGHAIGNHTFNHLKGWSTDNQTYVDNVAQCQTYLPGNLLFRPPYGRIKPSQLKALKQYKIVMWDVLAYDYQQNLDKTAALSGIIKATGPGSIIVFHDSLKAERNLHQLLPKYLTELKAQGYAFKGLQ